MNPLTILIALILVAGMTAATPTRNAQLVEIHDVFLTGAAYLELNKNQQASYASGLIDGMMLAPTFGTPKKNMAWLESCVTKMSNDQVAAILTKYLKDHPERWHQPAQLAMFLALKESCPQ